VNRADRCVVFAGGGTGGHLYPGLAIAERLSEILAKNNDTMRSVFACSVRPLDAEILGRENAEFRTIPAEPFGLAPRTLVKFVRTWGGAVRTGRALLRELRERHGEVLVVAMGGFVAAPMVQAARVEGCAVTLVNLDATPGKANRWIARHARRVFTAAEVVGVASARSWIHVPPIVRRTAVPPGDARTCRAILGLNLDRPTLLVTGASQGATSINDFVISLARESSEFFAAGCWQVIHQAGGKADLTAIEKSYAEARVPALVRAFLSPMGPAWGAADLAISRAGAGSVAEAWAAGVPTVFMPYPYHRDQHQRLNALPLESRGACVIATDAIDVDQNVRTIGPIVLGLMRSASGREAMRAALAGLGPADGAAKVAAAVAGGVA